MSCSNYETGFVGALALFEEAALCFGRVIVCAVLLLYRLLEGIINIGTSGDDVFILTEEPYYVKEQKPGLPLIPTEGGHPSSGYLPPTTARYSYDAQPSPPRADLPMLPTRRLALPRPDYRALARRGEEMIQ